MNSIHDADGLTQFTVFAAVYDLVDSVVKDDSTQASEVFNRT